MPNPTPTPRHYVTLAQIAKKAALSTSTVSQALNNQVQIALKTRERIQKLAAELGYKRNPAMTALCSYRSGLKKPQSTETIAFLHNWEKSNDWKKNHYLVTWFQGATARAEALGYKIKEFNFKSTPESQKKMGDLLYHQGIRGIVIPPLLKPYETLHFNWSHFSVSITKGAINETPFLYVDTDAHTGMRIACQHLLKQGYRRLGLLLGERWNHYDNGRSLGTFLMEKHRSLSPALFIDPMVIPQSDYGDQKILRRWIQLNQPDVLIGAGGEDLNWITSSGIRVPQDLGYFALAIGSKSDSETSGLYLNPEFLGEAAVNLVHHQLVKGKSDRPEIIHGFIVIPKLIDGKTAKR